MAQINIKKSSTFLPIDADYLGIGFDTAGNPVKILSDGTTTPLVSAAESGVPNVLANLGVGLQAALPSTFVQGDIFVTTDTLLVYTAVDAISWGSVALIESQFVTDTSNTQYTLYQFDGTDLKQLGGDAIIADYIDFNTGIPNPTHNEGRLFYDDAKKTMSYYNEEQDVTVNWNEILFRVYNGTGSTILNGKVVAPDAVTGITLADNRYKGKCQLVAVATHDIEAGTWGYVTKIGEVTRNTVGFPAGSVVLLGTDGDITLTRPTDGGYEVIMGVIDTEAADGVMTVDINVSQLAVEVTDTNGFPPDQRSNTALSVDEVGYEFTISKITGDDFHIYVLGEKYEYVSETISFDDTVEGEHWFYFTENGLVTLANPSPAQTQDVILKYAYIGSFYWNATDKKVEFDIQDERHGIGMAPQTHYYLHTTQGAQYISGFGLSDFNIGTGAADIDSQFSVAAGEYVDEDISHLGLGKAVGDTTPVAFLSGDSLFRTGEQTNYAVLNISSGRLYYNLLTGSTWSISEVANNYYVLYHIFGANGLTEKYLSVMGQDQYATLAAARAASPTEISNIKAGFTIAENIPIATIIFQTRSANFSTTLLDWTKASNTITITHINHGLLNGDTITIGDSTNTTRVPNANYVVSVLTEDTYTIQNPANTQSGSGTVTVTEIAFTNTTKSRIRKNADGNFYTNWTTSELAQGAAPTSHANLTNVLQAVQGVQDGHISDGVQVISGAKTFNDAITFKSDIYQEVPGTIVFVSELKVADNIIHTRNGAVSGLGAGEYTGIQATLYDGVNNGQLVFDNNGFARVGDVGSTVRIAAIEDAPINGGYATYNDTTKIFVTKSAAQAAIDLNYWTLSGGNIHRLTGNVGIGTATPTLAKLQIAGDIYASSGITSAGIVTATGLTVENNAVAQIEIKGGADGFNFPVLQLENVGDNFFWNIENGRTTPKLLGFYNVNGTVASITETGAVTATGFSQSGVPILRGSQSALPASTIDFKSANNLTKTLTAVLTLAFSNIVTDTAITLTLTTGATLYAVNLIQSGVTFGGYNGAVVSGVVQGLATNSTYDISFLALSSTQIRVSVNQVTF